MFEYVINLIIILMWRGTPLAALRPPHPALRQSRWEPQLMLAGVCGLGNQVRSPNHLIKQRVDIRFFSRQGRSSAHAILWQFQFCFGIFLPLHALVQLFYYSTGHWKWPSIPKSQPHLTDAEIISLHTLWVPTLHPAFLLMDQNQSKIWSCNYNVMGL